MFWASVRDVSGMGSGVETTYRDWSSSYYAAAFGAQQAPFNGQVKLLCPAGTCVDDCKLCRYWIDAHDLVVSPELRITAQGLLGSIDVTSRFSEAAITLLGRSDLTWTAAAEGGRFQQPGTVSMISLSADGTTVLGALAEQGGQIQPVVRSYELPGDAAGAAAATLSPPVPAGPGPGARSGFGVVLSTTESSLFVIGGTLASGGQPGDIWQGDVWSGAWQRLTISGPTPNNVLAATFVPQTRSIYYLDEEVTGAHQARLMRYDLGTYRTTVLGAWPRTPEVDRVFLTQNDDGLLVLAGSSSKLNYVAGDVLRPGAHSVTIVAGFYHAGLAAFAPVLTEDALTMSVDAPTATGIQHAVIPVNELFSAEQAKKGSGEAWGNQPGPAIDLHGVL